VRAVILALAALCLTGCAGMKLGGGYNFETKQFFVNLEKPLDGYKK
jgi:hypothetical protein